MNTISAMQTAATAKPGEIGLEEELPLRCIEVLKMLRAIHRLEIEISSSGIDSHITNRIAAGAGMVDVIDIRQYVRDTIGEAESAFINALFSDLQAPNDANMTRTPIELAKRINRLRDEIHVAVNGFDDADRDERSGLIRALDVFHEAASMLADAVPDGAG